MTPQPSHHVGRWYTMLGVTLAIVIAVGLLVGEVEISIEDVVNALLDKLGLGEGTAAEAVFWSIRMPRVVAAVVVGISLGASGAALQGVYRNPMADPYLLGISSAAGFGVVIGIALTPTGAIPLFTMAIAAIAGAGFALLTRQVYRATVDPARFVLVGVSLGLAFLAWTVIFVFVWDSPRLPTFTYFVFGSLGAVTWEALWSALFFVVGGLVAIGIFVRELDLLTLGDSEARHLGVSVDRVAAAILVGSGIVVGVSVGLAGVIGFVGLLAPLVIRRLMGPAHRHLIAGSALAGAVFVVGADVLARLLAGPVEVPVGIVTAAVGGPVLVWILVGGESTS